MVFLGENGIPRPKIDFEFFLVPLLELFLGVYTWLILFESYKTIPC